mgnify:FL=1
MQYVSTRGEAPTLKFGEVLLEGLAIDGGLYLPEKWPRVTVDDLGVSTGSKPTYKDIAVKILKPFTSDAVHDQDLELLVDRAYSSFAHSDIVPLKEIGTNTWLLELFHGPTLAFKDIALQLVGQMFDYELAKRHERITIVGATSGDTGSAAIEACKDRAALNIVILHPHNRTSEVQRRQMTTIESPNVHNIAIEGTFDDCQDLVKAMFLDEGFRAEQNLSAINSINWARVMAQIVYYWWAAIHFKNGKENIEFSVPSGNFGNIFAGYGSHLMGLDISKFIVGTNQNAVLNRFFQTGSMVATDVVPTLSPSMDIQIPSNFERLLFEIYQRNGQRVKETLEEFRRAGELRITQRELEELQQKWTSARIDDDVTLQTISEIYSLTGELVDPHTAVGIAAGKAKRSSKSIPLICLGTAQPGKFPEAVKRATGIKTKLPSHLEDLYDRSEYFSVLPNDLEMVKNHIQNAVID